MGEPAMGKALSSVQRLGVFFGAVIAGVVLWVLVLLAAFRLPPAMLLQADQIPQPVILTYTIGLYLWLMALVATFRRPWGGSPALQYGFRFDGRRLLTGWGLGLGGVLILVAVEVAAGLVQFKPPTTWPAGVLAGSLAAAMGFAVSEELLFRGLFLKTLMLDMSPRRAIAVSALLFAALHYLRPGLGASDLLPFMGLVMAGSVLAYAAWKSGSLWLPIGIHAGWVFFISLSNQLSLWEHAPAWLWLSGGSGPSSGVLGILLLASLFPLLRRHA